MALQGSYTVWACDALTAAVLLALLELRPRSAPGPGSDPQQHTRGKRNHGGQFNVGSWRGSNRIEQSWFHEGPPMTDIGVGVLIP